MRANVNLPSPGETIQIRQTFVPSRDGLFAVELTVVRPENSTRDGELTIQLIDSAGQTLASRIFENESLTHNQNLRLEFEPQPQSAGETYTLLIGGRGDNDASIWAYDLDVYSGGELATIGANTSGQDLRFTTHYQLSFSSALRQLGRDVADYGLFLMLVLTFIIFPGILLLLASDRWMPRIDIAAWLGLALGLGISIWPLLWMGLTLVGGRWRSWSLWSLFLLGWLVIIVWLWRRHRQGRSGLKSKMRWQHLALLLLLIVGLAVRLLAVRDLVFPPWVDSSRHALITTIMAQSGQVIDDFSPYMDVDRFPYHYGYHAVAAGLAQMSSLPLPGLQLLLGQFLNTLLVLAIYTASYLMTRRPNAALLAAFLLALPFFFPAYYATWGRMTQLTGLLVMAYAIAIVWLIARGARVWRQAWWLASILVAALFLIHLRVFLLFAVYSAVLFVFSRGRNLTSLLLAAGTSFVLVLPRFSSLLNDFAGPRFGAAIPGYNVFPVGYVNVGWERYFLILAAIAVVLAVIAGLRRRSWIWLPLILASWAGSVALLLSGERLGLPETGLINLNSAYISAFLPLAIILAVVLDRIARWLIKMPAIPKYLAIMGVAVLLTAMVFFGVAQQVNIINPVTILAQREDVEGLLWLEENAPESAKVAVNSWLWLGNTWASGDGGAWIVPLTGRNSTTPPVDYIYGRPLASQVNSFNEQASDVVDWSDSESLQWLRESGIDYIYVGAKGGFFDPSTLAQSPELKQVFHHGGVFIFAFSQES
jgi:hypothetical protein